VHATLLNQRLLLYRWDAWYDLGLIDTPSWSSALKSMPMFRAITALLICLLATVASAQAEIPPAFQPEPRPVPASVHALADIRLELYFSSLKQGGVGLLRLNGGGVAGAQAEVRGEIIPFFRQDGDAWYALVAVDMNTSPGAYALNVPVRRGSGDVSFALELRVESAGFIAQTLDLPGDRAWLEDAEIENQEYAALDALASAISPVPLWDEAGFELPHASELTSPVGAFRQLSNERRTRHTGWDQNLPSGSPVRALAAGLARFAGQLDIRGNYVLIDHGLGLYSGYAHFSELHVAAGQRIEAGEIIGFSGNSGRSSAPHLHWETRLRGHWVDGAALLDMWLPTPSASVDAAS